MTAKCSFSLFLFAADGTFNMWIEGRLMIFMYNNMVRSISNILFQNVLFVLLYLKYIFVILKISRTESKSVWFLIFIFVILYYN